MEVTQFHGITSRGKSMIKLINFGKYYNNQVILKDVNLEIPDNKITFIMGKNGAGKTTLVKCLLGLEEYVGQIQYNSGIPQEESTRRMLAIWDEFPFYDGMTGINNLYVFSEGLKSQKEIFKIAQKYLGKEILKRKVKNYSYGQRKKLSLILIEILEPKIVIMDEVSNGLDYETMVYLKKYIRELAKSATVVLMGHQFEFYNDLIEEMIIIKNGSVKILEKDFQNSGYQLEEMYEEELYCE